MASRTLGYVLFAIGSLAATCVFAGLDGSYVLPLDDAAIEYASRPLSDPVTLLRQRVEGGEAQLSYEPEHGYLISVLRNLNVEVSSQMLVFSKTSVQAPHITPRTPRALYFNDQVAVGWVPGGDMVEMAAVDPKQGVIFYELDQEETAHPKIVRRDDCLQCHATGSTLGVPGLLVRSVYTDYVGMPFFNRGGFITDHRSPISQRWGGYYVTGVHENQPHLGNVMYEDGDPPKPSLSARSFNPRFYLSPHSDIVALMTLEHQSRMENLITRVGYEARMAIESQAAINKALKRDPSENSESTTRRINNAAEELVSYLLFIDEAPLQGQIAGTSSFAADFERRGPHDSKGRSLRQFDLTRRMFRYPCSYLIYSEAFDNMPIAARDRVYKRLWEILISQDQSPAFARLDASDRRDIREILIATKKGLPDYWTH